MNLHDVDWGAQVDVALDAAGSGIELTLQLVRKAARS